MRISGESCNCLRVYIIGLILLFLAAGTLSGPLAAQTCQLTVEVRDTIAYSGQQKAVISIFMENYVDTVAGFNLWLVLNRPDIMEFILDSTMVVDTTYWSCLEWNESVCTDSGDVTESVLLYGASYDWITVDTYYVNRAVLDTAGTLVSGWELLEARSIAGTGYDVKISGMANSFLPPVTPGIGPQNGDFPLIKLYANIYELPEGFPDPSVTIMVPTGLLDNFGFSNELGEAIGIITDTVEQERCFACEDGGDPPCDPMIQVPCGSPDVDSIWCCDSVMSSYIDTDYVCVLNGTLTAVTGTCGDANVDGGINILDATFIIGYLYKSGSAPYYGALCDVNSDCAINILDVTRIIGYLYKGGEAPNCPPTWPCP